MLVVVQARFEVDWTRPEWIEDELIRSGARDARLTGADTVAVTVAAKSQAQADHLVRDLLNRVGATGSPPVALRSQSPPAVPARTTPR